MCMQQRRFANEGPTGAIGHLSWSWPPTSLHSGWEGSVQGEEVPQQQCLLSGLLFLLWVSHTSNTCKLLYHTLVPVHSQLLSLFPFPCDSVSLDQQSHSCSLAQPGTSPAAPQLGPPPSHSKTLLLMVHIHDADCSLLPPPSGRARRRWHLWAGQGTVT